MRSVQFFNILHCISVPITCSVDSRLQSIKFESDKIDYILQYKIQDRIIIIWGATVIQFLLCLIFLVERLELCRIILKKFLNLAFSAIVAEHSQSQNHIFFKKSLFRT